MNNYASQEVLGVYETLKVYDHAGAGIPAEELPRLLKFIKTAAELALNVEEELAIATRFLQHRDAQVKPEPTTIDQVGNVVRLPARPRVIKVVNPDGGDAA